MANIENKNTSENLRLNFLRPRVERTVLEPFRAHGWSADIVGSKSRMVRVLGKCLTVAVLISLTSTIARADSLTIATFNAEFLTRPKVHMKFGFPFDAKKAEKKDKRWEENSYRDEKFTEAAQTVAKFISTKISADVLALTEVGDENDVKELISILEDQKFLYPYYAVCKCTDHNTKQHVAVLSKFPLFDIHHNIQGREGYYEELDDPESEAETGISKGMRVSFQTANQTFHLYVVHLASERGGHEKDAQRIAQASIIRRHTLDAVNAGEHVIVAGDLNDRRGEPALRRIRGLHDMWPDLIQTGHKNYFNDKNEQWTYSHEGNREQIDHILFSQSIKNLGRRKVLQARTVAPSCPLVSDHQALVPKPGKSEQIPPNPGCKW